MERIEVKGNRLTCIQIKIWRLGQDLQKILITYNDTANELPEMLGKDMENWTQYKFRILRDEMSSVIGTIVHLGNAEVCE